MNVTLLYSGWLSLALAIIFGVMGTVFLKLTEGFRRLRPAIYLGVFYTISFVAMTYAIKHIELSTVYAVWSGLGTVLVAFISALYFDEAFSLRKVVFLILIILGVIGIHLSVGLS